MRILQLVHGYPPRETAGTEQHTRQLAEGLRARGHAVHVFSATRAPGRQQYSTFRSPGTTHLVNNLPTRPLERAERDRAVEAAVADTIARVRPDLVHVQHLQFLSSGLRFPMPTVGTLHDAWGWCAAGGTLLEGGTAPCPGPQPERCAPCAARWAPVPGRTATALARGAGWLAPVVDPDRLHALYRRLPGPLRLQVQRGEGPPAAPAAAAHRNAAMLDFYRALDVRIAPSRFLAHAAEAAGTGPVDVVPHGVPPTPAPRVERAEVRDGPFLFLGTVAHHKGPDLVLSAWRRAFPGGAPGLRICGPVADARLVRGHPLEGPLDRAGVEDALTRSRALVLGSRWPENAPLVILEARAAGCPVIAPAIGGVPELVEDGVDGWLYRAGDAVALERVLREAAFTPVNPRPPRTLEAQLDDTLAAYARAGAS